VGGITTVAELATGDHRPSLLLEAVTSDERHALELAAARRLPKERAPRPARHGVVLAHDQPQRTVAVGPDPEPLLQRFLGALRRPAAVDLVDGQAAADRIKEPALPRDR
jgi:hypothetical protein